jgi:hypothetical protein
MSADYMYMRPNMDDTTGTTPANGPFYQCPDIWIAGQTPVPNYTTALATSTSYASMSLSGIYIGYSNYFYVRAMNGGSGDTEQYTVTLYYAPSSLIQWPSQWQSNVIPTDSGSQTGTLASGVAPGSVGVCEDTFLWAAVPQPPSGHYCIFAQLNDASNANPFPTITSSFEMGTLIQNNLLWGWRNTIELAVNTPSSSTTEGLSIPTTIDNPGNVYNLTLDCVNMTGWSVALSCSQDDSDGNPIVINETTVTENPQVIAASDSNTLTPGFNATLTISFYSNGNPVATGASVTPNCNYQPSSNELAEAKRRGLALTTIGPTEWLCVGCQTYYLTSSSS